MSQVFNEATLTTLARRSRHRPHAILHDRVDHLGERPAGLQDRRARSLALGHNGNLVNTRDLAALVGAGGRDGHHRLRHRHDADRERDGRARRPRGRRDARAAHPARRLLLRDDGRAQRLRGPRPLRRATAVDRALPNGFVVASETCALDIVGASFVRDVEPGELIRIDDRGLHSVRFAESPRRALCIFESVYLARPDSRLDGADRARVAPRDGPAPRVGAPGRGRHGDRGADTGHSAAQGYSEVSGIPTATGSTRTSTWAGRSSSRRSRCATGA